ncbi:hypothetical protein BAZOLSSOX_227 [uncultured Gammaproteobacteria bacterium]|nr:hypothetical protein BAZOLSSOX_227 [uncultured Gammaproteobacteria bacterium]
MADLLNMLIHHHTGGLEMLLRLLKLNLINSPPHRWLRK